MTTDFFHAGVDEQMIMKKTGHRSVDGVRLYKRISDDQQRSASVILNWDSFPSERPKLQPEIQPSITTDKIYLISTYQTAIMLKLNIIENETSLIISFLLYFHCMLAFICITVFN